MTDAELVRAAREEDPDAWRELCERYLPVVWRYAYTLLNDTHAAQDVTSETMLALVRNICQLQVDDPQVAAWLRSVVRHKVADFHRRNYRLKARLEGYCETRSSTDDQGGISAGLEAEETRELVLRVLEGLNDTQRLLLEWKYGEGLRIREMAFRLDKSEKGVEAALYRARQEFRRAYELHVAATERTAAERAATERPLASQSNGVKLNEI